MLTPTGGERRSVVEQVCHPVTLDDAGGVVERDDVARSPRAKERATRSEHDGNDVHDDLVDEPESQRLTADLPGGEVDDRRRPVDEDQ